MRCKLFENRRPNPRAIDLNTLIEQVMSFQAPEVRDKGGAIDCELNPNLPVAFADAAQIQQVLLNLLADAWGTEEADAEEQLHRRSR
jgi:signal transduction histidine kinase